MHRMTGLLATLAVLAACVPGAREPGPAVGLPVPHEAPRAGAAPVATAAIEDAAEAPRVAAPLDAGDAARAIACDSVTDLDIDQLRNDWTTCRTGEFLFDAPKVPDTLVLRVTVEPPHVAAGTTARLRVSLTNTGSSPQPIVLDDPYFDVHLSDSTGHDPRDVTLGSCASNVLQIDMKCGLGYLRLVLAPGGSVHEELPWDTLRYRWGPAGDAGGSCPRLPYRPVDPGRYTARVEARLLDFGPRDGSTEVPLQIAPASTVFWVAPAR
jgi:hypothetical protein